MEQPHQPCECRQQATKDVMSFLREFKLIECSCCDKIVGFEHRLTGVILCGIEDPGLQDSINVMVDRWARTPVNITWDKVSVFNPTEPCITTWINPFNNLEESARLVTETIFMDEKPRKRYAWFDCKYSPNLINHAEMKITFVWNFNKYQVQSEWDDDSLLGFQERVQVYVANKTHMTQSPIKNEMVLAPHRGEYRRARIMQVKQDGYMLMFVDFGGIADQEITNLYAPDDEIMQFPIASLTVVLAGVSDCVPDVIEPMKYINPYVCCAMTLDLEDAVVTAKEDSDYVAWLWINSYVSLNYLVHMQINRPVSQPIMNVETNMYLNI